MARRFSSPLPRRPGGKQLPLWAIIGLIAVVAWQAYRSLSGMPQRSETSRTAEKTPSSSTGLSRPDIPRVTVNDSSSSPVPDSGGAITARVDRVVDGDTLHLTTGERVRLLGVDTPETVKPDVPVQPWGPEASAFTKKHVQGQSVRLEFDNEKRDSYGRLLAYVYVGEWFLNEELIRAGLSPAVTKFPYSAVMKQRFRAAESEARRKRVGIWSGTTGRVQTP